jgi:uncharacterized UPF0146 family protein
MNLKRCAMAYSEKYKRMLHRLGYYSYQQGLIHRHLDQDEGWNSHLEKCRNYIIDAVQKINPRKVTVIGSGWLLDLPLAEIIEAGIEVTLIDIVHPPEAYSQTASIKGIELIEDDASGGIVEEVWKAAGKLPFYRKLTTLKDIVVPVYELHNDPDLVISLNILSQLDVLPVEFLRRRSKVKEEEIIRFRMMVQDSHLRFLSKHNSLLITDISEIFTDSAGKITEVATVIADLPGGTGRREWTWDFDLKRSDYYEKRSVMKVVAINLSE